MMTLYTNKDLLIQVHKTELVLRADKPCTVRVYSKGSSSPIEFLKVVTVQELKNCYLLSVDSSVNLKDTNATLEVIQEDEVLFLSPIQLATYEYEAFPYTLNLTLS